MGMGMQRMPIFHLWSSVNDDRVNGLGTQFALINNPFYSATNRSFGNVSQSIVKHVA